VKYKKLKGEKQMEEIIEISLEEYRELVTVSVRVDCLRRMLAAGGYVSTSDMMAVLGIEKEQGENEAV
jgi:spore coat protein CotH